MDNAFLGPIISALGRSFLSRRNQNKTSKSNVHRIGLLIIAAYGSWIAGIGAIILFIGNTVNSGGNSLETFIAFGVAEFLFIFFGFMFYVWYRNAYVKITRTYVLRRTFLRFVEKIEYRRIRKYGYHERYDHNNNFEDGLYLGGPLVEGHKYSAESVELHSNWANFGYVLGQLAFRIVNERWAEPESDEDQNLIHEYVLSGRAREICLEQSGFVFPENDNSPYRESKE